MRLLLIGATGRTGRHVLQQAVQRGDFVTAIVRRSHGLPDLPNLAPIEGDPLNADVLARAARGVDAVISVLGQRNADDARLLQDAARAAVRGLPRAGVSRYVVVSQGLLYPTANPVVRGIRWVLRRAVSDSRAMEDLVASSNLDWTIVRAPKLDDGEESGVYRVQERGMPRGAWSMHRGDLAAFLLDEVRQRAFLHAVVGVA